MPVIPILPSINTCMSLTTTTNTVSNASSIKLPEVNTTQLQALAEVCSSVTGNTRIKSEQCLTHASELFPFLFLMNTFFWIMAMPIYILFRHISAESPQLPKCIM